MCAAPGSKTAQLIEMLHAGLADGFHLPVSYSRVRDRLLAIAVAHLLKE